MRSIVLALLLLAGCATPMQREGTVPGVALSASARAIAELPAVLASFRRAGTATDFEQRPGGAGMGASAQYVPANGERVLATVYIYDRGQPRRVDGGTSPDVAQELRIAAAEIGAMVRMGRYRSATPETAMDARGASNAVSLRCANFRIVQADGIATGDSACVSVQRGAFVKVRVTSWTSPEPAVAGQFAMGVLSAVLEARTAGSGGQPVPLAASQAPGQP